MSARSMAALAPVLVLAALAAAEQQPIFRADVELVTVSLTVTHRDRNRPVGELTAADFRVREDGVEQEVAILDHARRPVSLCVILDVSRSMTESRSVIAHAAIDATLAGLAPDDEVSLVIFADFVDTPLSWTPVPDVPPIPWVQLKPTGATALLDALKVALGLIDTSRNPRPVILIVSDGRENSSKIELGDVVRTRRQSETLTYAYQPGYPANEVRPFDDVMSPRTPTIPGSRPALPQLPPATFMINDFLRELVGDSGGTVLLARDDQKVPETVQLFLDELNAQYTLGYVPKKPPDGKYRKLKVEAKNRDLRVRHRGGYLAMPKS